MFIAVIVCCFILVLLLIYIGVLRPWQLRWGAADEEVKRTLPGDNLVDLPHFHATRAVTIQAPVLEVWKWLLQIGAGRAGFYSLDWIDNARKPSAREIIPAEANIKVQCQLAANQD
jgi:hypothetical protein